MFVWENFLGGGGGGGAKHVSMDKKKVPPGDVSMDKKKVPPGDEILKPRSLVMAS